MADAASALPLVREDESVRDAIATIDRFGKGIALAVDERGRLLATVTDGDVRRAILAGFELERSIGDLLATRPPDARPWIAPTGTGHARLLELMVEHSLRHIPLVDEERRVVELVSLMDLARDLDRPRAAVVMAGGFGRRLGALTSDLPKPMLPVGERPVIQRIVEQLRDAGIRTVNVATHYRADAIRDHFGDGTDFGIEIRYVDEDEPLGTAGALSLLPDPPDPLLVVNGDIVTDVDFRAMHEFHDDHCADMTVGIRAYEVNVPYGVVETDGVDIVELSEKPLVRRFVNAGIYLLGRRALAEIPRACRFEMPELVARLLESSARVVGFPLREYWLDIGQVEDYERALLEFAEER